MEDILKIGLNFQEFIITRNTFLYTYFLLSSLLKLMKRMKDEVYNRYAINLIPEIRFIGGKTKEENEIWKNLIEIM